MVQAILALFATGVFLGSPIVMIWGWVRWGTREKSMTSFPVLSLTGFVLATVSELLAISMVTYARISGGFAFYDPTLMRIYAFGTLLSLVGLILAIVGMWKPSSLRWHALGCTVGTLLYWFVQAASE
jgi:hypothetical protein